MTISKIGNVFRGNFKDGKPNGTISRLVAYPKVKEFSRVLRVLYLRETLKTEDQMGSPKQHILTANILKENGLKG